MALPHWLDFSANIRKHAIVVAVLLALATFSQFVIFFIVDSNNIKVPKDQQQEFIVVKNFLLGAAISNSIYLILFLVGFVKRQRWCLTICLVILAVNLVLQCLVLLSALGRHGFLNIAGIMIGLALNSYIFLVIYQLREVTSSNMSQADGFAV